MAQQLELLKKDGMSGFTPKDTTHAGGKGDLLHDWYPFLDTDLGKPLAVGIDREDGAVQREFTNGTIIYNPEDNISITITFEEDRTRVSDGTKAKIFELQDLDGDIFLK